jgi:hypothetical protein
VYNTAHIVQLTLYKTLIPVAGGLLWRGWGIPADCADSRNQAVPVPFTPSNRVKDYMCPQHFIMCQFLP